MVATHDIDKYLNQQNREIEIARPGDELLGPLAQLPGRWQGRGRGWNMIALPFVSNPPGPLDYRLLLNQFDETLTFSLVDKGVPNRGLDDAHATQTDQLITALDYEQVITQVAVTDRPASTVTGAPGAGIHHEPGLFLNMLNETDGGPTVARLATIPHGDAALALGDAFTVDGPPQIESVDGLPVGVSQDLENNRYLEPYKHFHEYPFFGNVPVGTRGFPGFDPTAPATLLQLANQLQPVARTTVLLLDTSAEPGGIRNIPFVVKQANASRMKSTFWINELEEKEANGNPKLQLQYLQVVILEFFPRRDGLPGRIEWPHVSINTMDKVSEDPGTYDDLTTSTMAASLSTPAIAAAANSAT